MKNYSKREISKMIGWFIDEHEGFLDVSSWDILDGDEVRIFDSDSNWIDTYSLKKIIKTYIKERGEPK